MKALRRFDLYAVGAALAFVVILYMALKPATDPDLFWHLASGRWMHATGRIPLADPFSWTVPGRRWIAHEWLTEIGLFALYTHGGFAILVAVFAAIITLAFGLAWRLARLLGAARVRGAFIVAVAAWSSIPTWGVRPQMITVLLLAILQLILYSALARKKMYALIAVPLLMILWINLHGGFIFGLAVIGFYAAGLTAETLVHHVLAKESIIRRMIRLETTSVRLLIALWTTLAASLAACLINPNGLQGLLYPFSYLGNNASTRYVAEWRHPDLLHDNVAFTVLLIVLVGGIVLAPRRPRPTELILAAAFGYLGLESIRNINLFAVLVSPYIAVYFASLLDLGWPRLAVNPDAAPGRTTTGRAIVNVIVVAIVAAANIVDHDANLTAGGNARAQAQHFPIAAAAYLRAHPPTHLFNSYDWGGYLIWTLYPTVRVYVDGRPDMYGDSFMNAYIRTWHAQPGWRRTLDRQRIDTVLVESDSGLGRALSRSRSWRVALRDHMTHTYTALLFVRRDPL